MKHTRKIWLLLLLGLATEIFGRPGGGHSYSSGSRSSSSSSRSYSSSSYGSSSYHSSGSGSGEIGFPVVLALVIFVLFIYLVMRSQEQAKELTMRDWSSSSPDNRLRLEDLRQDDPNFSVVLLSDFLQALYVEVQRARGLKLLEHFTPYLDASVIQSLGAYNNGHITAIIIGGMHYTSVSHDAEDQSVLIDVTFETNATQGGLAYYIVEQWSLRRKKGVLSRTPERIRVIGCPGCGAPLEQTIGGACRSCQRVTDTGEFDWRVTHVTELAKETRGPMLTGTTPEQGTSRPTVVDPQAASNLSALSARDPAFDWSGFQLRLEKIFSEFQIGWSNMELLRVRPYLSDKLFQTQTYWLEAYRQQRLRNITAEARIWKIELARVTSDLFFDSITVRVSASSYDYTVNVDNALVGGSREQKRSYTEYWTLIRGRSVQGPARTEAVCPGCGAPLKINMAGHCEYCAAKVSSGDFDWVLSQIEQDDSYQG